MEIERTRGYYELGSDATKQEKGITSGKEQLELCY
jgi:hypothetical protein